MLPPELIVHTERVAALAKLTSIVGLERRRGNTTNTFGGEGETPGEVE